MVGETKLWSEEARLNSESRPISEENALRRLWRALRDLTGDSAYERYLQHWQERHAEAGDVPLSRKEFYAQELDRKWNGVRRCC